MPRAKGPVGPAQSDQARVGPRAPRPQLWAALPIERTRPVVYQSSGHRRALYIHGSVVAETRDQRSQIVSVVTDLRVLLPAGDREAPEVRLIRPADHLHNRVREAGADGPRLELRGAQGELRASKPDRRRTRARSRAGPAPQRARIRMLRLGPAPEAGVLRMELGDGEDAVSMWWARAVADAARRQRLGGALMRLQPPSPRGGLVDGAANEG